MQHDADADVSQPARSFPTDPTGLPEAGRPEVVELADGDRLDLHVGPVAWLADHIMEYQRPTAPAGTAAARQP
jgi:hypothetical protein